MKHLPRHRAGGHVLRLRTVAICAGCLVVAATGIRTLGPPWVLGWRPVAFAMVPPARGATVSWIALGDTGEGSRGQRRLAATMAKVAAEEEIDFVTLLGDNFYPDGVRSADDEQWESAFADVYTGSALQVPFYAILGNHDYRGAPEVQVGWSGDPRWRLPARYYTFCAPLSDDQEAQFFMLDTPGLTSRGASAATQMDWLDSALAASEARWKIVAGHHTIHSGGKHGDEGALHELLEPVLIRHGVDLYLNGHDHHLAMMEPDCGLPIVVSGAGCKSRSVRWVDGTVWAGVGLGFAVLRLDSDALWVSFFGADGRLRFAYEIHD